MVIDLDAYIIWCLVDFRLSVVVPHYTILYEQYQQAARIHAVMTFGRRNDALSYNGETFRAHCHPFYLLTRIRQFRQWRNS